MKKLIIYQLLFVAYCLNSQHYTVSDFNLKGNVKRVSVLCYDIEKLDNEFVEGLPYSSQNRYHTDLNLHYIEFNRDGDLLRSKLFYPRDFYGQFSWLSPQFNLESSDFSEKKNYLTAMYRYKYLKSDDQLKITITSEDGTEVDVILSNKDSLIEDEYYTYSTESEEEKEVLTKKRKGSMYGFRRLETIKSDSNIVVNEYINNRFLVSRKLIREGDDFKETIFVSQSRIELERAELKSGKVVNRRFVNLSWRNKFLKWPDIDFDINTDYLKFLNSLERESDELGEEYKYDDNGQLISLKRFRYNYDDKIPLKNINYIYKEGLLERVIINPDPQKRSDLYFKEYVYDENGNWHTKTIGIDKLIKGETVRVPTKKYVKTLTYWD